MTGVTAIRVDDEKNVVDYSTDRLDSNLTIFTAIVQPLQCGTQEDARGIFEAEAAFVKIAPAFGFVQLEKHRCIYALSVVRSSLRPRTTRSSAKPRAAAQLTPHTQGRHASIQPTNNAIRATVC